MLYFINGKIVIVQSEYVVVDMHGFGIFAYMIKKSLNRLKSNIGSFIRLYTHLITYKDNLKLYAFESYSQLKIFQYLIKVSRVGPKQGLEIISTYSPEEIKDALLRKNYNFFLKVHGIGNKVAHRIILELKDKIKKSCISKVNFSQEKQFKYKSIIINTLIQLGLSKKDAIENIDQSIKELAHTSSLGKITKSDIPKIITKVLRRIGSLI